MTEQDWWRLLEEQDRPYWPPDAGAFDWLPWQAAADSFEESGRTDVADALRWLVTVKKYPSGSTDDPSVKATIFHEEVSGADSIPGTVWHRLKSGKESTRYREYDTLEEAVLDLAQALQERE